MSNNINDEGGGEKIHEKVNKILEFAKSDPPLTNDSQAQTKCKHHHRGIRRWRFAISILLFSIFLLTLCFTLSLPKTWLWVGMACVYFIVGAWQIEAANKEMESANTGTSSST